MPDLLLELFSEEIPARMQAQAQENLKKLVTDALVHAGLTYDGAKAFSTPRRLALAVHGLAAQQPDLREEKKGPRVGAPDQAIQGFLKSAGLKSINEAKVQQDKKGDFYIAVVERKGRPTAQVISEIVPDVVKKFPWPKSMRWGKASEESGSLTWVRPLHSLICTFGPETEEPEIVKLSIDGVSSGDVTHGHRVHAPAAIKVKRLDDYLKKLQAAKVVPDRERRKEIILADAKNLAMAQGLELIEDEALLEEAAGLVEWPVVLLSEFDKAFLDIPPEVIRATIRANQKCFVLRDGKTGKLANKFILVSNLEASDGGNAIKAGNSRVIRARLSDAKFFWEQDKKKKLEDRLPKLKEIVFHEKLGTQMERVERIAALAKELAPIVKADPNKAERAARLAKVDLVTEMVGEFPELQGLMGKYYAEAEGEDAAVARAIEEHYKPQGPGDRVPGDPVSIAVALADKIDTLVGFWAIDEKPTGSKDPYALRRAALGIIRLILENKLRLSVLTEIRKAARVAAVGELQKLEKIASFEGSASAQREFLDFNRIPYMRGFSSTTGVTSQVTGHPSFFKFLWFSPELFREAALKFPVWKNEYNPPQKDGDLLSFFADRLKVHLREQGARHDLVDAVFALEGQDDLLMIVRRVEALGKFLETEDGKNLLAGAKRAANILRDEEKKDKKQYSGEPDAKLLTAPEEKALASAVSTAGKEIATALKSENFEAAMSAMAKLRAPVDAFFDKVIVNADDAKVRENRLKLLNQIRAATRTVADFSKIEG